MDKAKAAVSTFLSKDGKHNTTVHETVNPAIQQEHINKTHHDIHQTVVDREVHQDHHHISVQPIHHKEVLPEQHTHQMGAAETKHINHGNDNHVRQRLEAEKLQFKNTTKMGETHHTHSDAGVVTGEHVHHHVHETIQPVIHKETVQPSVTHTTIPIHEIHQNEAKHHTATHLPPVSMEDFKKQGGHLSGREERIDAFEGQPKPIGGTLGGRGALGSTSLTEKEHQRGTHGTHSGGIDGIGHNGNAMNTGVHNTSHIGNGMNTGVHNTTHSTHNNTHDTGLLSKSGSHDSNLTGGPRKKASLLDKINPKVDSNGDGKAGFMK